MDLVKKILSHEGPATIVTEGKDGAHVAATWNFYVVLDGKTSSFRRASFIKLKKIFKTGSSVQMLLANKDVPGKMAPGTGVLNKGIARFEASGNLFEQTENRFPWARTVLLFTYDTLDQ